MHEELTLLDDKLPMARGLKLKLSFKPMWISRCKSHMTESVSSIVVVVVSWRVWYAWRGLVYQKTNKYQGSTMSV